MVVLFQKAILCDVVPITFEEKTYWKALLYSDRNLYQVSVGAERVAEFKSAIGHYIDLEALCREYTQDNGKVKLKYSVTDFAELRFAD